MAHALAGLDSGCYWIIDDTGFPKKGKHSVGVARQYCGQLGKQDNCQVAVSLSLASVQGSIPIAYQLYLPQDWAADPVRRKSAGVPETQAFTTKPEIALAQMRQAVAAGVPMSVVLADAGYGDETAFLMAVRLKAGSSASVKKNFVQRQVPAISKDYIPRGSPARAASRSRLERVRCACA